MARSADCSSDLPGTPRERRWPHDSKHLSRAQGPGYEQINQYRLYEPIGQGSCGIVKRAYNEDDNTHYAMKILSRRKLMRRAGVFGRGPPRRSGSVTIGPTPDPMQRVYREITVLKKLDHPNVVKLVEVIDDPEEDQLYLVFKLLEGGPVIDIPTDNPLSEKLARKYFRDALLGVEYLHYKRIVHRDIKPANLLLGKRGVQVGDLSACGELAEEGNVTGAVGTPAFRAPETYAVVATYNGEAADIWSLGVTLFAMVTGQLPWTADNIAELQPRILQDPLVFPKQPTLSPRLTELIQRMLDKDPVKRATMPEIKEHAWVTQDSKHPLSSEQKNFCLVKTGQFKACVITCIRRLSTIMLIKTMLKNHSFKNPFLRSRKGSTNRNKSNTETERSDDKDGEREVSAWAGSSLSPLGNYLTDRQASCNINLESVTGFRDQSQDCQNLQQPDKILEVPQSVPIKSADIHQSVSMKILNIPQKFKSSEAETRAATRASWIQA